MAKHDETRDDGGRAIDQTRRARPGLVAIVMAGAPSTVALELGPLGIELGRGTPNGMFEDDDRVSRKHVRIRRTRGVWQITDLQSRNGTFVAGKVLVATGRAGAGAEGGLPVRAAIGEDGPAGASAERAFAAAGESANAGAEAIAEMTASGEVLIRIGRSLLWAVEDVTPFLALTPSALLAAGPVVGGRLQRCWSEIALASRSGSTLYVRGESGSGKELGARAFHDARFAGNAKAPFVAVNCAAIPEGLAERLLFGAQRGAYSGATTDAEGYVQAAHKGTLFLDEIAELDPLVQAKLLRVLETREVLPLGATKPRSVEIAVCAASHRSLRDEVAHGRFREDLYFRLGRPEVQLPPLRERLDEQPWLIGREFANIDPQLVASPTFVEACALRPWPGNVRELLHEVRRAAHRALHERVTVVEPHHLSPEAGLVLAASSAEAAAPVRARARLPSDQEIERALRENDGNVRGTARALGIHRNQLRRWLERRNGGAESQE